MKFKGYGYTFFVSKVRPRCPALPCPACNYAQILDATSCSCAKLQAVDFPGQLPAAYALASRSFAREAPPSVLIACSSSTPRLLDALHSHRTAPHLLLLLLFDIIAFESGTTGSKFLKDDPLTRVLPSISNLTWTRSSARPRRCGHPHNMDYIPTRWPQSPRIVMRCAP